MLFEMFKLNREYIGSLWDIIWSKSVCTNVEWKMRLIKIWFKCLIIHSHLDFWLWEILILIILTATENLKIKINDNIQSSII